MTGITRKTNRWPVMKQDHFQTVWFEIMIGEGRRATYERRQDATCSFSHSEDRRDS